MRALQKEQQDFVGVARQALTLAAAAKAADLDRLGPQIEKEAADIDVQVAKMVAEIESFTEESTTAAKSYETAAKTFSATLSVVGTIVAILVSFFFVAGLRTSVTGVTGLAMHISDGNLRQEKLTIDSTDELGQLALIFNDMLGGLRDNVSQTRAAAESLNAAVVEIVASVREQAAGTSEQAAAVQETTATMEEISQSGNRDRRARQAGRRGGGGDVHRHQPGPRRGAERHEGHGRDSGTGRDGRGEHRHAQRENAGGRRDHRHRHRHCRAVESARAERRDRGGGGGRAGADVRVVANEIKNLADQAKEATGKVRSILGDIQKGINTSVMLTEEVVKRVDSGKKQSDVVERTIKHMAESLSSSIQAFQQITAATGQQQIGFDQVTQALKNIRQAADQTAVSTSQLEKAATNLTGLGQQLNKNVERYRT